MIVPPFIPGPREAPGNVTEAPYLTRVRFQRNLVVGFALTWALVVGVGSLDWFDFGPIPLIEVYIFALALLSLARWTNRGSPRELWLSLPIFPVALASAAGLVGSLDRPWLALLAPGFAAIYAVLSGRDFSFIALFGLSGIITTIVMLAMIIAGAMPQTEGALWILGSLVFLGYLVYDMSMIKRRRRPDEVMSAVIDLYRDPLNVLGYPRRVYRHWQRHRLWTVRLEISDVKARAIETMKKVGRWD